jgi:phage shock protein PspC (stress-responsive transcriptional regulator)
MIFPFGYRSKGVKKLHRLADDKKLAGVCAGLGEYFDVDPVFFRLFFLVSLLFGGLGALVYLLLWVMTPEKAGDRKRGQAPSLHLSRSDRKIAGVCGGLGEWLDVDPVFLRVAFILLVLLFGLGIVVYIVLWLFVPRAPATPASKA